MGGEEFAVLLEGTGASAGLASTETAIDGPGELYARADAAMYQARRAGRDRLALSGAVFASAAAGPRTETAA